MNEYSSHGAEVGSILTLLQIQYEYDNSKIIYINNKYDNKKSKWTLDSPSKN